MSSLMTIGDFSRAVRLSAKALRFYHQNGILAPALVDEHSGYRLYAAEQIPDAQVIRSLRALRLPLPTIREILAAPDITARAALLSTHLGRLEQELAETQAAAEQLRGLLSPPDPEIAVTFRTVPAMAVLSLSEVIELGDLEQWFRDATAQLQSIAARAPGSAGSQLGGVWPNELIADGRGRATVFLTNADDIADDLVGGGLTRETLPPVEVAVAVHRGSDDRVPRAYAALGTYVALHQLATDAPAREIYLEGLPGTDPTTTTEIQWPVFRVTH
ncbi:MerR family transcriptional regulator [Microbacterium schleiferi]|uniref:MerR family transcriptional regulator n=1 Tax=Microbacterium schleiferi TaxID=69362 RepID=A0ABU7V742_9MICO|nr:MerR family transcriptional regulator [Micrococcales bacterium]